MPKVWRIIEVRVDLMQDAEGQFWLLEVNPFGPTQEIAKLPLPPMINKLIVPSLAPHVDTSVFVALSTNALIG